MGSFVNALVYRLHEQPLAAKTKKQSLSITRGRSICPHCKHTLAAHDLVPVISWILLRGKCRYCHKPIHWQYPVVEVSGAGLFAVSYLLWPYTWSSFGILLFGIWLMCLVLFLALLVYDLKWMILPNRIVYLLIGLAVVHTVLLALANKDIGVVMTAFWGVVCTAGFFYVLFQLSSGKWIGGGDVKLAIALGMLIGGPLPSVIMLFIASFSGSLVTIPSLLLGKVKRTSKVPFGPFLLVATIVVYLFGAIISQWYEHTVLGL
jgi:prepilin signal peptidase PulO-like enzyme (type II secretory pathway)